MLLGVFSWFKCNWLLFLLVFSDVVLAHEIVGELNSLLKVGWEVFILLSKSYLTLVWSAHDLSEKLLEFLSHGLELLKHFRK